MVYDDDHAVAGAGLALIATLSTKLGTYELDAFFGGEWNITRGLKRLDAASLLADPLAQQRLVK